MSLIAFFHKSIISITTVRVWASLSVHHVMCYTHSDPDESSSTVPLALMLRATPFSCSGTLALAPLPFPSLEEEPREEAGPAALTDSSLWIRLMPFLSAMGDSCFFFKMPETYADTKHNITAFILLKVLWYGFHPLWLWQLGLFTKH